MGDAATFRSGREFAAFLGLVPRQSGTGGKVRLGSISKRGDPYLRTTPANLIAFIDLAIPRMLITLLRL